jgi:CheY-like chemotaxis protein
MSAHAVRRTLLLVEDDAPLRETLGTFLADEGFDVHAAADGDDALELVISEGVRPAVIVLDLGMPRLNGWELLAILDGDEHLAYVPRVVITGFEEPGVVDDASTSVLTKPFDSADLMRALHRAHEAFRARRSARSVRFFVEAACPAGLAARGIDADMLLEAPDLTALARMAEERVREQLGADRGISLLLGGTRRHR